MSWITEVQDNLLIKTGDGKTYSPDYLTAVYVAEYNHSIFHFANVFGSKIDRRLPMGRKFTMELYFQGPDHLTIKRQFINSAFNPKYWVVTHPLYRVIYVQPIGIQVDDSIPSVTKMVCNVMETNDAIQNVVYKTDSTAVINNAKIQFDGVAASAVAATIPVPKVSTIQKMRSDLSTIYGRTSAAIANTVNYNDFINQYNQVNRLLNNTTYDTLSILQQTQTMLNLPSVMALSVVRRVALLKEQMQSVYDSLIALRIGGVGLYQAKKTFELIASNAVTAMCIAAVTFDENDYPTRQSCIDMIDTIAGAYDTFVGNIDSIQDPQANIPNSYSPSISVLSGCHDLVVYTINNLLDLAANSKVEMSMYLDRDTDIINLTWELYGMDTEDANIKKLIASNNITGFELWGLAKGRKIIYYK